MRLNARRFALARRVAGTAIAVAATLTTVAALGAPSALAAGSVSVATQFENSPISLNTSDAIGYAIANTTGSSETVTFTDTLPAGVTLDDPIGTTNTNGGGTCTALAVDNPSTGQPSNPGDGVLTVTATVPSVTGSSSTKPVCTISLSIVASSASVGDAALQDSYSGLSPSTITATTGKLVVLSNPTVNIASPTNNQSFTLGQVFNANFSCAATDPLDSIDSFFGTDDEGNQIASGAPIDTVDPGAHSLEVDCYSAAGGGDVSQTINYKVGSYKLTAVKTTKTDQASFKSLVPAGKIVSELVDGKKVIGTTKTTVLSRKTVSVKIKPTTAGKKVLAAVKGKNATIQLHVSFTPNPIGSGDSQISSAAATVVTKNVKLPIAHPAKSKKK
ncbi:MAG TPA: hypothetical protein VHV75_01875 [Solirubrobacteraceae bacterium]|nr:hypothetical protein [Solirubrobacteraceae bacterium]